MKKILNILIFLILGLAINETFSLVLEEWNEGYICPKILETPACYIVVVSFSSAFIFHLLQFKSNSKFYFFSISIVTVIALFGTIGELMGWTQCPRSASGILMCFISLGVCFSLLILKHFIVKSRHVNIS